MTIKPAYGNLHTKKRSRNRARSRGGEPVGRCASRRMNYSDFVVTHARDMSLWRYEPWSGQTLLSNFLP